MILSKLVKQHLPKPIMQNYIFMLNPQSEQGRYRSE